MKLKKICTILFFCALTCLSPAFSLGSNMLKIDFYDTEQFDPVAYQHFSQLFSANFDFSYNPCSKCFYDNHSFEHKDFVLLNLSTHSLKRLHGSTIKSFFEKLQHSLTDDFGSKFYVIFLPTVSEEKSASELGSFFVKKFALDAPVEKNIINFLRQPVHQFFGASTSLYTEFPLFKNHNQVFSLSLNNNFGKRIVLVKNELLYFQGMLENSKIYPVQTDLQNRAEKIVHSEFESIFQKRLRSVSENSSTFKRPKDESENFEKLAWLDIFYAPCEQNSRVAQLKLKKLAELSAQVGLTGLWITPAINNIFSPIGVQKEQRNLFLERLSFFLKWVKSCYEKRNLPLPNIYFGYEIANNLVGNNYSKTPPEDLFGNRYFDQPNPLDSEFWQNEVVVPFKNLFSKMRNSLNQFGVGVVIDFEMYLRKTGSTFASVCGFDEQNIDDFCSQNNLDQFEPRHYQDFFNFLEGQAYALGLKIAKDLKKVSARLRLGFYVPCVPPSWFYKGFLQGFGKNAGELDFFSFYSKFQSLRPWFEKNKIFVNHYEVFMLSKLNQPDAKELVAEQFLRSDGIWLNRWSRINEAYSPQSWFELEQCKDYVDKSAFFKQLKNLGKKIRPESKNLLE